jgi:GNAT superfamily N-acetyltransferase
MPWLPVLHSREEAIDYFAGHVLVHEEVLVAEVNELLVGFMALETDQVDHLYIAPSFQGRGISDKLLAMAKELRPNGLTLWTFQRNTGQGGFTKRAASWLRSSLTARVTRSANPTCYMRGRRMRRALAPDGASTGSSSTAQQPLPLILKRRGESDGRRNSDLLQSVGSGFPR